MGRNRTPTNVLQLRGAFEKHPERRREEPKVDSGLGEPPERFDDEERAAWREIEAMAPQGILSRADRITVELMVDSLIRFRNKLPMKAADKTFLLSMLSRFGMTPADRSKVAAPKSEAQGDLIELLNATA